MPSMAITGYQEILTDPSYCRQLVTLTYPLISIPQIEVVPLYDEVVKAMTKFGEPLNKSSLTSQRTKRAKCDFLFSHKINALQSSILANLIEPVFYSTPIGNKLFILRRTKVSVQVVKWCTANPNRRTFISTIF